MVLKFNEKELKLLQKYNLNKKIENTESKLYIIEEKEKWKHYKELLKVFKNNDEQYLNNKIMTIKFLLNLKDELGMKELVLPTKLVLIENEFKAFTMPFIEKNTNISLILNSLKTLPEDKIFFLKEIGKILQKTEENRICNAYDFHIGDIHEGNFIYDNENNYIKSIDLDSCKIGDNFSSNSKFLTFNDKLWDFPTKYPLDENDRHISNKNTTILSYVYIILNTISNEYFPDLSTHEFYNYLNYLLSIGFDKRLTDLFANIYSTKDNYFDMELMKTIAPKLLEKTNYSLLKK